MIVSRKFFNNIFEPGRKASETNIGRTMTQKRYTDFLAEKNFKLPSVEPIKQKKIFQLHRNILEFHRLKWM
jgi:hypothetical protein